MPPMSPSSSRPLSTGNVAYDTLLHTLCSHFDAQGFRKLADRAELLRRRTTVLTFQDGARIELVYPGLKAGPTHQIKRYQYDFRVDLCDSKGRSCTISHAEIVLDLYTKVARKEMSYQQGRTLLRDIRDGRTPNEEPYVKREIPKSYLEVCRAVHEKMNKQFRRTSQTELPPFQIATVLIFILAQEEANYPSYINGKQTPFSGRSLALDRYSEAIWAAAHAPKRLEEVLLRTLQEYGRPKRWEEVLYDLY